ncbi:peptidase M28 [Granulicella tundricola MP5ACTX9]|uniref:Carboxypeptidase Q n=1 Tax=Granulicella tundricola (strain ATCC BAA-1859 / DSM 23138 / MP5ACTX9) TaxID=1198114 RepID=E8X5J2_GRATM|nr:peptidase M28 [Granulicella tundricola MP5ACTX9]
MAAAVCLGGVAVAMGQPQPASENVDLAMYSRIRDEGFNRSHVMEYGSALFDDIGPRLTGSPAMKKANEWTRQQLTAMGCANAHLESWGEFGMGWTQKGASLEMMKPGPAVFLAQATPWSPSLGKAVTAEVVRVPSLKTQKDLDEWKGKLAGKVILYGDAPKINPDPKPLLEHYDVAKLAGLGQYPLDGDMSEQGVLQSTDMSFWRGLFGDLAFKEKVAKFFAAEKAVAVLTPGGSGGVIEDDTLGTFGWYVYRADHKQAIPEMVIANEAFGRMSRLLAAKVPVTVKAEIETEFSGDHEQGYNTIAEIPGSDPALKDQVVMVGGHLDSWIAGTGATDNGAGTIVAMEAMRILTSLGVKPRRTIRIGLWSGEEQGIFGSSGYVSKHFAEFKFSKDPKDADVPEFLQTMAAAPVMKPEAAQLSGYFNMDNGTGKLLGIYAEGNAGIGSIFQQWMAPLKDLGMTTVSLRNTGSTDHVPFQMAGLPGFQFIQDPRDYETRTHHTNQDVYERLSPSDLKQASVIEAIFLYNTAMRDAMLPRPELPMAGEAKPLEGLFLDATKDGKKGAKK